MSNKLSKTKNAPLAQIPGEQPVEFVIKKSDINQLTFNNIIMSDFEFVSSLKTLRKFHKNVSILKDVMREIQSDGEVIRTRAQVLVEKDTDTVEEKEKLNEERGKLTKEAAEFYEEPVVVSLYTVNNDEFVKSGKPIERSDFGVRQYFDGTSDKPKEVKYVVSYLDLFESGVITE